MNEETRAIIARMQPYRRAIIESGRMHCAIDHDWEGGGKLNAMKIIRGELYRTSVAIERPDENQRDAPATVALRKAEAFFAAVERGDADA